jgi:hypothetical protein
MKNFIATSEKIKVENYPYSFTLRTTLFNEVEFNPKKGYRLVTTTINPKTNRLNKPKKSTYSDYIGRYKDENNHIKTVHLSFNGDKEINKSLNFLHENFALFTTAEIEYFYLSLLSWLKVSIQAQIVYNGSDKDKTIEAYQPTIKAMVNGLKDLTQSNFNNLLDIELIESLKDKDFNPFKVTSYSIG